MGVVGVLLATLLRVTAPWPLSHALLYGVPMARVYGFVCLSAWWVCRAAPLARAVPLRTVGALLGAALLASVVWAIFGTVWSEVVIAMELSYVLDRGGHIEIPKEGWD